MLEKEPRGPGLRGRRERGVGARGRGRGRRRPPRPAAALCHAALRPSRCLRDPRRSDQVWGPRPCHRFHPHPCCGGVAWREGGFKSPRVSDPADRSPNSSLSPAARFRAPGWHATLPWTPRRLCRLPGHLGSPTSPRPYTRRTRHASYPHGWLLFDLLASEPTPLSPAPASRCSQLPARRIPNSEVRGMGTVCRDPSETQSEDLTSPYSHDWDLEALLLPGGMRPAGARASLLVLAQEVETARNEPRRVPQHTSSFKLTVW